MNTSIAQDCAHPDHEESDLELLALYYFASAFNQFVFKVYLQAAVNKDTAPLYELIRLNPRNKKVKDTALNLISLIEQALAVQEVQE